MKTRSLRMLAQDMVRNELLLFRRGTVLFVTATGIGFVIAAWGMAAKRSDNLRVGAVGGARREFSAVMSRSIFSSSDPSSSTPEQKSSALRPSKRPT